MTNVSHDETGVNLAFFLPHDMATSVDAFASLPGRVFVTNSILDAKTNGLDTYAEPALARTMDQQV